MKKYKNTIIRALCYSLMVTFLLTINILLSLENILTDLNTFWVLLLTFASCSYLYMVLAWKERMFLLWVGIIVFTQCLLSLAVYELFYISNGKFWDMMCVYTFTIIIAGYSVILIAIDTTAVIIRRIKSSVIIE